MAFNISEFRGTLKYGGARTNLFEVKLSNPVQGAADNRFSFRCTAAGLPSRTLNKLPVSYFGREIKVAGVVNTYDDWTVEIIEDEDYVVRDALEAWSHAMNAPITNVRRLPTSEQTLYKTNAEVTSYAQTGSKIRHYKFHGIFPVSVAEVPLSWENDALVRYAVTFSVDYWTLGEESKTGFAGGFNI